MKILATCCSSLSTLALSALALSTVLLVSPPAFAQTAAVQVPQATFNMQDFTKNLDSITAMIRQINIQMAGGLNTQLSQLNTLIANTQAAMNPALQASPNTTTTNTTTTAVTTNNLISLPPVRAVGSITPITNGTNGVSSQSNGSIAQNNTTAQASSQLQQMIAARVQAVNAVRQQQFAAYQAMLQSLHNIGAAGVNSLSTQAVSYSDAED